MAVPLADLVGVSDPAWPALSKTLTTAAIPVDVLPVTTEDGERCLHLLQVSVRNALGALALHTGGVVVDHGWLRILGGGAPPDGLPDVVAANGLTEPVDGSSPYLLVAVDVLGGRFVIKGRDASLPGEVGEVCYFSPDDLTWEPLGLRHNDWVDFMLSSQLGEFYDDLRWPGWEEEVAQVPLAGGILVYPFLGSAAARADLAATTRTVIPLVELHELLNNLADQVANLPPEMRTEALAPPPAT